MDIELKLLRLLADSQDYSKRQLVDALRQLILEVQTAGHPTIPGLERP